MSPSGPASTRERNTVRQAIVSNPAQGQRHGIRVPEMLAHQYINVTIGCGREVGWLEGWGVYVWVGGWVGGWG